MNQQLIEHISFNIFIMIPDSIILYYCILYLLDIKQSFKRIVLTGIIMAVCMSIPATLLTVIGDNRLMTLQSELLVNLSTFIVTFIIISFTIKKVSLHLIGAILLTYFFHESIFSVSTFFSFVVFNLKDVEYHIVYTIISYLIIPALFSILILILKRVNFKHFFIGYFKHKLSGVILSIILLFLAISPVLSNHLLSDLTSKYPFLLTGFQLIVVTLVLFYIAFYLNAKERVEAQEALITEQDNYLNTLEQIQKEMRVFQHDYKNMLSALYLQAEVGDTQSIQNYISDSVINIDKNLADKIKRTTNLANIQVTELKSLILTKLIQMEQKEIKFELEVMSKIDYIEMDTPNLVRCLGILIDNAIEATNPQESIKLVLSNEDNNLLIAISNPVMEELSINQVWSEGYSTKGDNRGLGLHSYQKIISSYPNAFKHLTIKDNTFTQILRIERQVAS